MHNRVRTLAAVVVGAASLLTCVKPADAYVQMWEHSWQRGGYWDTPLGYDPNLHVERFNNGVVVGDNVSGINNYEYSRTCFYRHAHYGGDWMRLGPYVPYYNLPEDAPEFDNAISSFRACD